MTWKKKACGGVVALIGFILSPLSWWNDLFVNIPIAVGCGWLVALLHPPAFGPAVVTAYWLTNLLGLVLLQKGLTQTVSNAPPNPYSWRAFGRDVIISLLYTLLIVLLIRCRIIQPVTDYFSPKQAPTRSLPPAPDQIQACSSVLCGQRSVDNPVHRSVRVLRRSDSPRRTRRARRIGNAVLPLSLSREW